MPRRGGGVFFWGRVTYTTVSKALTTPILSIVPLVWWSRSPQRTARGPSCWQVSLVSLVWCADGSKSCRWFQMRVPVLVEMPVPLSIQREHVLRASCAVWSHIVATSQVSGEWFGVMRCRRSACGCVCLWGQAAQMARVGMEAGQPPDAANALVTVCVAGWRKVNSDFNTVFVPLLLLAACVGFPAACF